MSNLDKLREGWDNIFKPPLMMREGACPMCGIKTDEIADWWLSQFNTLLDSMMTEIIPKWDDMKGTPENWEGYINACKKMQENYQKLKDK